MITNRIFETQNPGQVIPYLETNMHQLLQKIHKISNARLVIYLFGDVEITGKLYTSYFLT